MNTNEPDVTPKWLQCAVCNWEGSTEQLAPNFRDEQSCPFCSSIQLRELGLWDKDAQRWTPTDAQDVPRPVRLSKGDR